MRVLAHDLKNHIDSVQEVRGWLYKQRLMGGLSFLVVRDRTGLMQVLVKDPKEIEKLHGMQNGTVLHVKGKVVKDDRAPLGVELHEPIITIEVPVTDVMPIEVDKSISHKSEHLDSLFEHRVVNIRNIDEQKIFMIRAAVNQALRNHLVQEAFVEIQTPKILSEASEGGTEVFKLDYYGKTATLAQSPQLYKQILIGAFERVFEIGPVFRAEPSTTTRHMSEVTMLDIEMAFTTYDELLKTVETMVLDTLKSIYDTRSETLQQLGAPELVIDKTIPRYTVAQIHEMYTKDTGEDTTHEKDLIPAEERWICEYATSHDHSELVFATEFPIEAMKFYHKINPENDKTVLWADLLFRGVEIATVPMRENNFVTLQEQMNKAGLDLHNPMYKYYLEAFQYGLPAHGGCGFGVDRFVQKIIGLKNIKEATLFPRDMQRLTP